MKKIFFNDICILVSDKKDIGEVYIVKNKADIKAIFNLMKDGRIISDITLRGYEKKMIFEDIISCFVFIIAAGGVVRKGDEYLLIKRFGMWDIPKGKAEKGESIKETAIREVEEETGVRKLKILKKLKPTYHIFETKSGWKIKKTYWFLMTTHSEKKLTPQKNEDITKAVWMGKKEAAKAISGTYRSIADTFSYLFK